MRTDPCRLVLTRQALPTFDRSENMRPHRAWLKAPTFLADAPAGKPEVILMASGSEVSLCVSACEKIERRRIKAASFVIMPSWELFERQDAAYKRVFFLRMSRRVSRWRWRPFFGWERYVGPKER